MKYVGNYPFLHQSIHQIQQISVPWENDSTEIKSTCLKPGMLINMIEPTNSANVKRKYWAAITDYVPGHVFVNGDEMINDFKSGDVYEFENIHSSKGAANISLTDFEFLEIIEYIR